MWRCNVKPFQCGDAMSNPFNVGCGVKQGCVLASTLFTIFLAAVLQSVLKILVMSIYVPGAMGTTSNCKEQLTQELLFADASVLVVHSLETMQRLIDAFSEESKRFGLTINIKRTEVVIQDSPAERLSQRNVFLNESPLTEVDKFTYLGSTTSKNGSIDAELTRRIHAAATAFGKLRERLWNQKGIHLATKMKVY